MDETQAPAAGSESTARDEGISNVAAAVAEMERREQERAAAKKSEKAAEKAAADDEEDDDSGRPPAKRVDDADDEEDAKPKKKAKAVSEGDDAEDESDDDQEDDHEDDDEPKKRARTDDGEEDDQDESEPEKKPAPPAKVTFNLNGRDIEATPDEVASYVKEAAEERHQIAQARQSIQQQAQQLAEQGRLLAQIAQQMIGQEPDIQLAQSDPGAYIAQQALYRQRMQVLQKLQGHTQSASQTAQAQQQQAFESFVQRERQALLKAVPELADPANIAAFNGRIQKVAQKYGLTADELAKSFDHRSFLMLRDLSRLQDMEAERAKARDKLKGAPPLKAPEQRAGSGQRMTSDLTNRKAKQSFLKSPKTMRDVRDYLARTER